MQQNGQMRSAPRRLLRRYVVSIGLVTVMVLGGFGLNLYTVRQGVDAEEAISISSDQRMLSQRIVLSALRYDDTQNPEYRRLLVQHLMRFTNNHNWLLERIPENTSMWTHYFNPNWAALDSRTRHFISVTWGIVHANTHKRTPPEMLTKIEALAFDLLEDLSRATALFERTARERTEWLASMQVIAMLATLAVIGLKAAFVFAPTHRQLSMMIQRLGIQAERDPLTGLNNRREFMSRSQALLATHQDNLDPVFLLAADLDGFKEINDTLGHPAGDVALRKVAEHLRRVVGEHPALEASVLARPGGDEFLAFGVVRQGNTAEIVQVLADTLIAAVEEPIYVTLGDLKASECRVGVSIGIALGADSGGNIDVLVSNGDIALYESKRAGKGVATAFTRALRSEAERRNLWNNEIRRGLKEMEFKPFFQPQIELGTGRVVGLEALARWHHPEHGIIGPDMFMDQVENAHRADALDGQIILSAVECLRACRDNGIMIERMSVNVSETLLRDPLFADSFCELIAAHSLKPSDFAIEVLETVVLSAGEDEAVAAVRRLQRAGFMVAIDDFGIGYSSLESVTLIGGSILKIDHSLVSQMRDPRTEKVLDAATAIGRGLGARLFADGIESLDQMQRLQDLGVECVQGHLICQPVPLVDVQNWMRVYMPSKGTPDRPVAPIWAPQVQTFAALSAAE